jgi:hypothetical protein
MVLYLRTILTWLGFLFNTTAPRVRFIVRQYIFRIRKLGIRAGLQTLLSRLLAYCRRISPKNSYAEPATADFAAASTIHPVLTPVNGLSQGLLSTIQAADQLQVQHPAAGPYASIDSRPPSLFPTEWDPNRFKTLVPNLCQRYNKRVIVYVFCSVMFLLISTVRLVMI